MERTIKPQKKHKDCPICMNRQRVKIDGEILQGDDLMLLSNRYEIGLRDINRHLYHIKAQLVAEVSKDAEEVLERMIKMMAKKYEEE